jgi:hypothetical protein
MQRRVNVGPGPYHPMVHDHDAGGNGRHSISSSFVHDPIGPRKAHHPGDVGDDGHAQLVDQAELHELRATSCPPPKTQIPLPGSTSDRTVSISCPRSSACGRTCGPWATDPDSETALAEQASPYSERQGVTRSPSKVPTTRC